MAEQASEHRVVPFDRHERRPARLGRRRDSPAPAPRVVAEILEDGTVRSPGDPVPGPEGPARWASGRIVGAGWALWWERRGLD